MKSGALVVFLIALGASPALGDGRAVAFTHVAVIDTEKNEIAGAYPIQLAGGATAIALDEPNHRVFVACR